jgi:hypothetical protein
MCGRSFQVSVVTKRAWRDQTAPRNEVSVTEVKHALWRLWRMMKNSPVANGVAPGIRPSWRCRSVVKWQEFCLLTRSVAFLVAPGGCAVTTVVKSHLFHERTRSWPNVLKKRASQSAFENPSAAADSPIARFASPISDRSAICCSAPALFGLLNDVFVSLGNVQQKPVSIHNRFCHLPSYQPSTCGA